MTNAARIMPRFALGFALLAGALTLPASAADVPIKGEIRSASDFKGRRIAEGAALSTKSYLTHFMTLKAGLPATAIRR